MSAVLHALGMAFAMGWEIFWPLNLGFALSAVVQAVVSHREMSRQSVCEALVRGHHRRVRCHSQGHVKTVVRRAVESQGNT